MADLQLLSGGAAAALVGRMEAQFRLQVGLGIKASFNAVGAMRDQVLAGAAGDVVILTDALIRELAQQGWVDGDSARPLGVVRTGIAVKDGEPRPGVDTAEALAQALDAAPGIYFPDPVKATAGIHFMKVLKALGGRDQSLAARLRPFPNGATAMGELARAAERGVIGCTQVTEILHTQGTQLVGVLPREFELATVYTAAVCTRAAEPVAAAALVALLAGGAARQVRAAVGFEER